MDVLKYIELRVILLKEFHISPSEFENMPFWEYELFIEELNRVIKEDNDKQQKKMDEYERNKPQMPKFSQPRMPKMPTIGKMKF